MLKLRKIISGGQTGADRAALDAAMDQGVLYGGAIPSGRMTEEGPLPLKYRMVELKSRSYPVRTERNVIDADATVIMSHGALSQGSLLTRTMAVKHGKPFLHIDLLQMSESEATAELIAFLKEQRITVLNVAGPRASGDSQIYSAVYTIIDHILKKCGDKSSK